MIIGDQELLITDKFIIMKLVNISDIISTNALTIIPIHSILRIKVNTLSSGDIQIFITTNNSNPNLDQHTYTLRTNKTVTNFNEISTFLCNSFLNIAPVTINKERILSNPLDGF